MPNLQTLALDTTVPQIRAPGTGDGYSFDSGATNLGSWTTTNFSLATGNLTFSSTAQRITGDFSNATLANRLSFQSSTTNGVTSVQLIPNGTATTSNIRLFNGTDTANSANATLQVSSAETTLTSGITGTGTYLPMTFYTGGSERMRLDTSGNLGIGTASPESGFKLHVVGNAFVQNTAGQTVGKVVVDNVDQRLVLASYFESGVGQYSYISSTNNAETGNTNLFFRTGTTDRMVIDSSGNVGIGTTSPVAGYRLNVVNDSGNAQQLIRAGTNFNSTIAFGDQDSSTSGQLIYAHNGDYMAFNTNAAERMRIDSSGNVGIGGTGFAFDKVVVTGTLPTNSNVSLNYSARGTAPSGTTTTLAGFNSFLATAAASFTCTDVIHFNAAGLTIGAGSTVTNQYGFRATDQLTGATNNYGFYSNIASGSNRWNFYAAGTARNYFAGRTDVTNTRIEASNNWNGPLVDSTNVVNVANGGTVTLTSAGCGAVMVHVYDAPSGQGGVFFATYNTTVTKVAGDGEATDTGSTFAVYKSALSHTLTFKNKYGGAARDFRIAIFAALATT